MNGKMNIYMWVVVFIIKHILKQTSHREVTMCIAGYQVKFVYQQGTKL